MSARWGLTRRLTIGILAYVLVVSLVVAAHGYVVNERAEHLVWESLLTSELEHFVARRAADEGSRWTDTETLKLYGAPSGTTIPMEFAKLPLGVHDEVRTRAGQFVALVSSMGGAPVVLALEISDLERRERALIATMALSVAGVAAVLALLAHAGARWLVRPLAAMVETISSWTPERSGQRLPLDAAAPREAAVIAAAFNDYLENLDRFVERERAFLNTASHELRTPIAVVASSAEVALEACGDPSVVRPSLERVLRTARDMERLVALLLALAKDPARLRAAAEPVVLGLLVPSIVDDHRYLAEPKELVFDVVCTHAAVVQAPSPSVRAAIGNLVRNAIENSDRGVIRVEAAGSRVVIADPGHGMSDEEMAAVYTRLARAGAVSGGGIGLDLIGRLCAHLGWVLTFESQHERGTRAILDFGGDAA